MTEAAAAEPPLFPGETKPPNPAWRLPRWAVLSALAAHLALQAAAFVIAGFHFDYPLDDPYIHLALAEQITAGGYGVNAGVFAAAGSSPIYPLLLTPFAGEAVQRYLPLAWNLAGLILAAWLWGRILWRAGYDGATGIVLAAVGPIALNFYGLAYLGMEHALHLAASLAIVLGLLRLADGKRLGLILTLGIVLSPLLRFEGLALALLASIAVFLTGRRRQGAVLIALSVLPVAAFCAMLLAMGLHPVPSSVYAKLAVMPEAQDVGPVGYVLAKLGAILTDRREQILAMFLGIAVLFLLIPAVRRSSRLPLLLVLIGAGGAHQLFGRFGWLDRYEIYILGAMAAGLLAIAPVTRIRLMPGLVLVPMLVAMFLYLPLSVRLYPHAPRAVWLQQGQMARFAKEHLKEPVAVNDLGYVAWANPSYVLDVWGLANREALRIRLEEDQPPGWLNRLTDAQDVPFAMVYDEWFKCCIGDEWHLLGQLILDGPAEYLGGKVVDFWLTEAGTDPAPYIARIEAWTTDLPEGASFVLAPGASE